MLYFLWEGGPVVFQADYLQLLVLKTRAAAGTPFFPSYEMYLSFLEKSIMR